jgi:hypothetical protein
VVRKDAPGAAEASTRLTDALLKMTAPDAVKNFAKFGVNIEKVLKDAVAKGVNPMEAAVKELQRVTGGDAFKLSQIFGDKEAKLALMSLMKYREEYEKLKAAAGGGAAAGTVQADFEASLKTFSGQLQSLTTSGELLALSLGNVLLPILGRKQKAAAKQQNEAKRLAAAIAGSKSQLALTKAKFEIEGKMLQAQQDDDKALQIRLTAQGKFAEIRQQIADIRADKEMKAEQKLLEIQNQEILGLGVAREMVFGLAEFQKTEDQRKLDAVKAYLEKQYELNTSVQQQLQLADSVSGILGQGMTSAFDALIQGSEDFGKSLRNIASGALVDIAKQLIRIYIIEQAINSIKSFLTPFSSATPLGAGGGQVGRFGTFGPNYGIKQYAAGGTPPVGRPSLVGERGPELFMPGVRGSIIPNHALGGGTTNVVVNVDASGSSVEGDQSQAKALGNAISAAVQSELVKQKRPGGLLA